MEGNQFSTFMGDEKHPFSPMFKGTVMSYEIFVKKTATMEQALF